MSKAFSHHLRDRLVLGGRFRRSKDRDRSAPIGHGDTLAVRDATQELTEAVLQLANSYGGHDVATS
jgi:hypothetical protein